jgi:hypothetical protein
MRSIRRFGTRVAAALAVLGAMAAITASPASAGTCYTVTVQDPTPHTVVVCPLD